MMSTTERRSTFADHSTAVDNIDRAYGHELHAIIDDEQLTGYVRALARHERDSRKFVCDVATPAIDLGVRTLYDSLIDSGIETREAMRLMRHARRALVMASL